MCVCVYVSVTTWLREICRKRKKSLHSANSPHNARLIWKGSGEVAEKGGEIELNYVEWIEIEVKLNEMVRN